MRTRAFLFPATDRKGEILFVIRQMPTYSEKYHRLDIIIRTLHGLGDHDNVRIDKMQCTERLQVSFPVKTRRGCLSKS